MESLYVTLDEFIEIVYGGKKNMSKPTILKRIHNGEIPSEQNGRRIYIPTRYVMNLKEKLNRMSEIQDA